MLETGSATEKSRSQMEGLEQSLPDIYNILIRRPPMAIWHSLRGRPNIKEHTGCIKYEKEGRDITGESPDNSSSSSSGTRWAHFPEDPADTSGHEDDVFAPLATLFAEVTDACVQLAPGRTRNSKLVQGSIGTLRSSKSNDFRPDGYLLRESRAYAQLLDGLLAEEALKENGCWEDLGPVVEFEQLDDPDQRSTVGVQFLVEYRLIVLTIPVEDLLSVSQSRIRVQGFGFFPLCRVVVTEGFNFVTEHDLLIQIFASFAFAEERELGWDPTVRPCLECGRIVYEIDVDDAETGRRTFKTIDILVDRGLCGGGARVFTTRELGQLAVYTLKDVWQDIDHEEEGVILRDVREKLKDETALNYILTPICCGRVKIEGMPDGTLSSIVRGQDVPLPRMVTHLLEQGDIPSIRHRAHYRIVFKEGKRFATRQLMLYKVNFLHRNVNSGNVLWYQRRGILTDFDFLNNIYSEDQCDPHIGKSCFTAIELEDRQYLYAAGGTRLRAAYYSGGAKHNVMHDIESTWWIHMFCLYSTVPSMASPGHSLSRQRKIFNSLFANAKEARQDAALCGGFNTNVLAPTFQAAASILHEAIMFMISI
ncbi:hypothetical protein BV25DRAFT_1917506 [Artomyces pyxidatus]|uniref:Uncharacterized protein n=1 Tax=Artomyces pyxidatus TaxID=48021 RepID=A0ACB8SXU9_9AGAM|nr:hypothetical protein BV25DRAFT_1917506 [Artomyces pyxidatus]